MSIMGKNDFFIHIRKSFLTVLLVILASLLFFWWTIKLTKQQMRKDLLRDASTIASTINFNHIKSLSGTKADLNSLIYLNLKKQLQHAQKIHKKAKFVYLMGQKPDGAVFFFADNVSVGGEDESPAGQLFEEVSPGILDAFTHKKAVIDGPSSDRWGTWISALIPVIDPHTNELVALFGIDIEVANWNITVLTKSVPFMGVGIILIIFLLMLFNINQRKAFALIKPVQRRLLIPLTLTLIFLLVGFCIVLLKMHSNNLNQSTREIFQKISYEFNQLITQQSKSISVMEDIILQNKALRGAMETGEKKYLLEKYSPLFVELRKNYGITHFYFHRPDRVNLLRIHKADKSGDLIDRLTAINAERTGKTSSGIELGPLGTLTLRVVKPVFDGNKLVGYLELGKEIEDIVSTLHSKYNVDLTVIIHKKALKRTDWEAGMKMLGRDSNWDRYKNVVLVYSSLSKFPSVCRSFIEDDEHPYYHNNLEVEFNDKPWKIMLSPLTDLSGFNIGDLIILKDVSRKKTDFRQLFILVIGCAILILIIILGFLYIVLRQTDRGIEKQQTKLTQNEGRFKVIAKSSSSWLWEVDITGKYTYVSDGIEYVLGYLPEEVLGKTPFQFMSPEKSKKMTIFLKSLALSKKVVVDLEKYLIAKNGDTVCILTNAIPLLNDEGELTGYRGIDKNITNRKNSEERLYNLNKDLEQQTVRAKSMAQKAEMASIAKSEFVANISHDTRTPLNGILGMCQILLRDKKLTGKEKEHLEDMYSSAKLLLSIINDILDIAKIESGKMELECIPFNLNNDLKLLCSILQNKCKKKGIELIYEYDEETPNAIFGDSLRVKQVVMNLLSNAVKFTHQGSVTLRIGSQKHGSKERLFTFEVIDSGIGISKEKIKKLFNKFSQADSSTTREYGGTGLGLFISKQLVEMMQGNILVESEEGKGCKFIFNIPFSICTDESLIEETKDIVHKLKWKRRPRVLVAEDSVVNHKVTDNFLKEAGCISNKAWNGKEAIEKFESREFDIIYMDIHMPELDGLDATRRIRKIEKNNKLKPIIIVGLSASAMKTEQEACRAAGMDDFLAKPLDEQSLRANLSKHLPNLISRDKEVKSKKVEPKFIQEDVKLAKKTFITKNMMDSDFYDKMIEEIKKTLRKNLPLIEKSIKSKNMEQVAKCAHLIKGEAITLELLQTSNVALELEMAGKDKNPKKAQKVYRKLVRIIQKI